MEIRRCWEEEDAKKITEDGEQRNVSHMEQKKVSVSLEKTQRKQQKMKKRNLEKWGRKVKF